MRQLTPSLNRRMKLFELLSALFVWRLYAYTYFFPLFLSFRSFQRRKMNPNFGFHLTSGLPPAPPQSIQPHSMQSPQIPPAPAVSPTGRQSVPGRRTPLGNVGIGGFYAQSALSPSHMQHQTDENLPSGSRERYIFL